MRRLQPYDHRFFEVQEQLAGSELVVLPLLIDWLRPRSLVDVGCGLGWWARAAMDLGVRDVVGIDGEYVPRSHLKIAAETFVALDIAQHLRLARRFDIALCLEVAEHLAPERGEAFIEDLCRLSDVIVFSAAVPHQGGTDHRNERWQSDWSGVFKQNGYDTFDLVRPRVWWDERVASYYRQNCLIYATGDRAKTLAGITPQPVLDCVHPDYWLGRTVTPRDMVRLMPAALLESARYHLRAMRQRAESSLRRPSQSPRG
jgi:SAM-dependent methyltransferase